MPIRAKIKIFISMYYYLFRVLMVIDQLEIPLKCNVCCGLYQTGSLCMSIVVRGISKHLP